MTAILVGTASGCRVFHGSGEEEPELAGRQVGPLASTGNGVCCAIVDNKEIWQRSVSGTWSKVAAADIDLQSILSSDGAIFCGGQQEATILRIAVNGQPERLQSFDHVAGRSEWFAGGPPLGVRSLAATADGNAILAAVHVGGIPRSEDRGASWTPTIPVAFDVHEVRAHPFRSNLVAAAAAVGLCISYDSGQNWEVLSDGLEGTTSLALAVLETEVLFSVQESPFAKRSQLWRWPISGKGIEVVRDGLPAWLEGRVDTAQMTTGDGRAVFVDGGGNLWLSKAGSRGWERIATQLPYAWGLLMV